MEKIVKSDSYARITARRRAIRIIMRMTMQYPDFVSVQQTDMSKQMRHIPYMTYLLSGG